MGRRVLITGLDTFWGGRMAQALENEPDVEMILGLGANEPRVPLERTEFVRSDQKYSILNRIVRATQVDTIVHTFLETNSVNVPSRALHEINVIGTLNLLAAAGTAGSSVRQVVVKSSTHVYGAAETDPAWFREEDQPHRPGPDPGGALAASRWRRWSGTSPRTTPTWWCRSCGSPTCSAPTSSPRSATTCADGCCPASPASTPWSSSSRRTTWSGPSSTSPATASPGCSTWPGRASCRGARWPPSAGPSCCPCPRSGPGPSWPRSAGSGSVQFPPEMEGLVRYGRGVDTTKLIAAGFEYRYTSAGAVESFARANNLRRATGTGEPDVPLRAGRGAVLPALPGRGAGHRRVEAGPVGVRSPGDQLALRARWPAARDPAPSHSSAVMA